MTCALWGQPSRIGTRAPSVVARIGRLTDPEAAQPVVQAVPRDPEQVRRTPLVASGGAQGALGGIIQSLRLAPARAAILIALGVGVMLESLTGYGVSMLVTVPSRSTSTGVS